MWKIISYLTPQGVVQYFFLMTEISFSYAITNFDPSDSSGSFHRDSELTLQCTARSKGAVIGSRVRLEQVTQTGAGDFRISLLLIRGHNFNFILMAAIITLGCESILLGKFGCELLWTRN
jgi:hypothetical protein